MTNKRNVTLFSLGIDNDLLKSVQEQLKNSNEFKICVNPDQTSASCLWDEGKLIFHFSLRVPAIPQITPDVILFSAKMYFNSHLIDSLQKLGRELQGEAKDVVFRVDNKVRQGLLDFTLEEHSGACQHRF